MLYGPLFEDIAETIGESLLVLDADLKVLRANQRFYEAFRETPQEAPGRPILEIGDGKWDIPQLRTMLEDILPENERVECYDVDHLFPGLGRKVMRFNARRVRLPGTDDVGILLAVSDMTEHRRLEEQLQEISLRDQLTELHNRLGFVTFAEQQFKAVRRTKRQMMLAFLDVDDMQTVNETFGHEEGDRILIDTANILRRTFRESDIIGRIGGDEFAVLSNETTDTSPLVIGERLKHCLDAYNGQADRRHHLSLSVGMAVYKAETPCTLDDLMAQADTLMHAKQRMRKRNRPI